MTRKLFLIAGLIYSLNITNVSAQISFGINSGLNFTSVSDQTDEGRWDSGIGYRIGGYSEIPLGKFGLHFEADYSNVPINGLFNDKVTLHYVSLPVTLFYSPIRRLKIFAGPEINFLIGQSGPEYQPSFGEEDGFKKLDYGAHVEIEFIATKRLGISIRNYFGLQYNREIHPPRAQSGTGLNKLNIFGLGVNYSFTKSRG